LNPEVLTSKKKVIRQL